ncbi:hypothetical protein MJO28_004665, partial [Puccinia striiformis f. sp. tritici]
MAETDAHTKTNIPPLTENNYLQWSMRMTAYLCHMSLLKYVIEPPIDLSGAAATAVATKHAEVVHILMSHVSNPVFDMVVTPDIAESPFSIWESILARFASTSVNNKGRVWLRFMRYEYRGALGNFISDMRKMLNEIQMLNLGVPDNILSFSILAKLSKDLYNLIDNIIMNEVICESPTAVLSKLQEMVHLDASRKTKSNVKPAQKSTEEGAASALMHESSKGGKGKGRCHQKPRCDPGKPGENGKPGIPGKHNPAVTSHDEDHCWQLHPELRPASWGTSAAHSVPATQLVEVDDGHESKVSLLLVETNSKPIVMDTGGTQHMVNDSTIFMPMAETNIRISTGGHKNFLNAIAVGSAVLSNQDGEKLLLDNVLLVDGEDVLITINGNFKIHGTVKNNLLELPTSCYDEINFTSACYSTSAASPNWHARLGHPNPRYQKLLVPQSETEECEVCKLCKLKTLPFNSKFKEAHSILEVVHMELVGPFATRSAAGFQYFLTLVDQFSGFKVVKFLKSKDEAFQAFLTFKSQAEKQTGQKLQTIISDGGGEFVNEQFAGECQAAGISHHELINDDKEADVCDDMDTLVAPPPAPETNPLTSPAEVVQSPAVEEPPPLRVVPKNISSKISIDNVLSVDRRGNSIL